MKKVNKITIVCIIFFTLFFNLLKNLSLYSRVLTETEIIPSAQAISLAESVAARKGLAYSSFNPAAGGQIKNLSILFNHLEWFLDYKVDDIKISIPVYNKFNIIGGGTIYYFLNLKEYNESSIHSLSYYTIATYLSLNKTVIKNSIFLLDAGISTKFINYKLINEKYTKLLFDGGILLSTRLPILKYSYKAKPYNFSIGIVVQNLLLDKDYKEMPLNIRTGINYFVIFPLTISVDYIYGKQSYLCSGIEYLFKKRIYIRIGYKFLSDIENISFGAGVFYNIRKNHFILNYSFSPSLIGNIHTLSLKWIIKKKFK